MLVAEATVVVDVIVVIIVDVSTGDVGHIGGDVRSSCSNHCRRILLFNLFLSTEYTV